MTKKVPDNKNNINKSKTCPKSTVSIDFKPCPVPPPTPTSKSTQKSTSVNTNNKTSSKTVINQKSNHTQNHTSTPNNVQTMNNRLKLNRPPVGFHAEQGPRDYMEDTYQIMHFDISGKKGTFYGVFDGHGGKDVSYQLVDVAGGLFPYLIEALKKVGNRNLTQNTIQDVIQKAYLEYDEKLYKMKFKAGSTACVILHFDDWLYLINLGDSRALVFLQDEEIIHMTTDHKPWLAFERNRIYRAGHYVNPFKIYLTKTKSKYDNGDVYKDTKHGCAYIYLFGKWEPITMAQFHQMEFLNKDVDTHRVCNSLALSRSFGDFYLKLDKSGKYMGPAAAVSPEPDIEMIHLKPHKGKRVYLFIGSDGFWDVSRITENFRKLLKEHKKPDELCKTLVNDALQKGSQDNVSVVFDQFVI